MPAGLLLGEECVWVLIVVVKRLSRTAAGGVHTGKRLNFLPTALGWMVR